MEERAYLILSAAQTQETNVPFAISAVRKENQLQFCEVTLPSISKANKSLDWEHKHLNGYLGKDHI